MNDLLKYGFFAIAGMAIMYFILDIKPKNVPKSEKKPDSAKKPPASTKKSNIKHSGFFQKSASMNEFITQNDPY